MGLLPTESSDWLAWREPRVVSDAIDLDEGTLVNQSLLFPQPLEFSPVYP